MKPTVLLLFFLCFLPLNELMAYDEALIDKSGKCPAAESTLYRGIRGNFFTGEKVIKNMLGDETAEHFSWRLSNILTERFKGDMRLKNIKEAKKIARKELMKKKSRALYPCGLSFSVETHIAADKKDSLGIPASLSFDMASAYSGLFGNEAGSILRIDEKVPRAGRDYYMWSRQRETEYYFPISIPSQDITGAWLPGMFIEKVPTAEGKFIINIREYEWKRQNKELTDGKILFQIERCEEGQACVHDENCDSVSASVTEMMEKMKGYLLERKFRIRSKTSQGQLEKQFTPVLEVIQKM